jgi:predicted esterase
MPTCRPWRPLELVLLSILAAAPACESDPGDEEPDPGWQATSADVRAVVDAGCTADALATLDGAEPASVRDALVAVDAELKLTSWTAGVTHGHPVQAGEFRTPLLNDFAFDYSLFVPEDYTADPAQPLPLFFSPGHPVDDLQDDLTFPYLADLLDQPFLFAQDNMYNRLYTDLGEDGYYDQVYYNPDFDDVAVYQDHQEIVRDILRQIQRDYVVDTSRIYVGGVSAEGNASWSHGIQSADRFAALLPVSAGTAFYHDDLWRNLQELSVLVVHGTEDDLCPVEDVDALVAQMEAWGFDVEYWREDGEGHGTMFYGEFADMVDWLLQRQRDLMRAQVHKALMSDRDTDVYWLGDMQLAEAPDSTATMVPTAPFGQIEASWLDGEIDVQTEGIASLTARWLEGAGDAVQLTVDGQDLGSVDLVEDATVAVEDYCRHADLERMWVGRIEIPVP